MYLLFGEIEMKKTYLFDFDGTLVDSMPTFVAVMLRILDERGIKYGDDIVKIITPLGYRGYIQRTYGYSQPYCAVPALRNCC